MPDKLNKFLTYIPMPEVEKGNQWFWNIYSRGSSCASYKVELSYDLIFPKQKNLVFTRP